MEKGIDPNADYGKQFLNARGGEPPHNEPPRPTQVPDEPSGRSVGQMVLIGVVVVLVLGGAVAAVALGGGGGSVDDDLITAEGIEIDEEGRPVRTTTTEATTTTTEATTTTTEATTTTSTTTTTVPGVTTVPGFPPGTGPYQTLPSTLPTLPPTLPATTTPPCPSGSVATNLTGATVTIVGGAWKVDVTGTTTNNTTGAITLQVTVPINYVDEGGGSKTVTAKPAEYGRSIAPGATLNWSVSQPVTSPQQPRPGTPTSAFSWTDSSFAACPTGV